jgi:putative PEP-CTERM system TPR-repeat lipoprotein
MIAVAATLPACSVDSVAKPLVEGRAALDRRDYLAASVHLRNALQQSPQSALARFLFGRMLLETGDVRAAEAELRKALELRQPEADVLPLLARCVLAQQKFAQVVSEFGTVRLAEADRQAELSASVASALALTGQYAKALELTQSSMAAAPANIPIRVAHARLTAGKGDLDGALKLLDDTIGRGGLVGEALRLKGDLLLYGRRDLRAAQEAYTGTLKLQPDDVYAQSQLVGIHLLLKDIPAAKSQQEALAKAQPALIQTKLLGASIALASGEAERARDILAQLQSRSNNHPRVLLLSAATELKLNSLVQAENHLNKVLSSDPGSADARRLLAATMLRKGNPKRALEVLKPLLDGDPSDAATLTLAAEAHLMGGDHAAAEAFFARVQKVAPTDVQSRTALAVAQVIKGDREAGLGELRVIAADDKGTLADMALISTMLRLRNFDGALAAIDELDKKLPDKPMAADLRGRVLRLKGDIQGARAAFTKALARDPVFFQAALALAQLDADKGDHAVARQRFESMLKVDPKNVPALVALAGLRAKHRAPTEEVAELLNRAVEASPGDASARVILVEFWLEKHNPRLAGELAKAGLASEPDHPLLLDALGRAQLLNEELAQAITTFGKLAAQQPNAPTPQLRLAETYFRAGNVPAAERSLRTALNLAPDSLTARRSLMALAMREKKPDKALRLAREVQRQRPKEAIGHFFEGEIHSGLREWDAAAKAYRAGLDKEGGSASAVRLHAVLRIANRAAEADRFAADWLKQNPADARMRVHLAEEAFKGGNLVEAERLYTKVAELEPRNAVAANDLAYVMIKNKNPAAVAMAERALALWPDNPNFLDTLAVALAAAGQVPRALEASKSAVRLAPNVPVVRLTLAKLYLQTNDRPSAKNELEQLAKLGDRFAGYDEVTALLRGL